MICFIQLQAAIGLGIFLMYVGAFLLFAVLPALTILFAMRVLSKLRKSGATPAPGDYFLAYLRGLVYAIAAVFGLSLLICVLIYFFIDLSYC